MDGILSLLKDSPLESVQLNTSSLFDFTLGDRFCMQIADQHRDHLIRFSLHGPRPTPLSIDHVCLQCTKLEQLFICVELANLTKDIVCFIFLLLSDLQ